MGRVYAAVGKTFECKTCEKDFGVAVEIYPTNKEDELVPCPRCEEDCMMKGRTYVFSNACMRESERPIVWYNPSMTPDEQYKYPGRNDVQMPERYRQAGYVKKEFVSLREHERHQKEQKLINHKTWDIRDSVRKD